MDIQGELARAGAVLLDKHFVYKSKKHGSGYINMDPLFPDIELMKQICYQLAHPFFGEAVDTVVGPATGGILLAAFTAAASTLWTFKIPKAVWADKDGADFVFGRAGFVDHLKGKKVLLVEDLLTTGGSVAKVGHEAELHGAEVIGCSVVCNRGGVTAETLGVPRLESLLDVSFEAIEPDECPLCAQEVPIVRDIGHGQAFEQENPNYAGGYYNLLAA